MPGTEPFLPAFIERLRQSFEQHRDPARAAPMAAYMRSQFPFLGIPAPLQVKLVHEARAGLARPGQPELAVLAETLWALPEREYQYAALHELGRGVKGLDPRFLPLVHTLVTTRSWWDTVDTLAGRVVGPLALAYPEVREEMDRWAGDTNLWVRRTAILHQLNAGKRTDTGRLFAYCLQNSGDPEFFIRKALGWALRQYSKTDERAVRAFVAAHPELSALSRREALKWLDRRAARTAAPTADAGA
jgi:3-methyladenine DNA glycosylase AlkD